MGFSSFFPPFLLTCSLSLAAAAPVPAATLRGLVTDPDGRATPGARVVVSGPIAVSAEALTDQRGEFRIDQLGAGRYELRVALDGFRADPLVVTLGADDDRRLEIRLRLSAVAESVVVSAAQVDVPLSRTASSVTVISAAELKSHQIDTVADALRMVPGLTVTRSGGRGAITSLFPRGGESDFTLVLVDGIRVNAFGGGFDFAQLPVSGIDRIEIVRGPQSARYGSDAIGAVVHIITRHGGPLRAEGALEAGSFGTHRLTLAASGSYRRWSWGGNAERTDSDGFNGQTLATGELVTNDDHRLANVAFNLGWQSDRGRQIRGDVRVESTERGFPGPFGSNPLGFFSGVDRVSRGVNDTRLFSLGGTHPWTDRVRQRAQVTYADLDSEFASPFGTSESETRRLSLRTQADILAGRGLEISAGIEVQRERAGSTFITGASANPIPIRRRIVGSFTEARYEASRQVFLIGGLRVDHIRRDALEANFIRPALGQDSVVSANPKLSAAYYLQPMERRSERWTKVRASAGTGIRPPDAFEIAFADNPNLKPERSRSVDMGVEQALMGGALVIEGTAFFNRYDDLIIAVGPSLRDASRFRTDNISNARSRGLELVASARSRWGLEARVTYTLVDTEILAVDRGNGQAPPPFTTGDPLVRRPRHQGSIDTTLTRGRVTAYAQAGLRGRMLDVEPSFGADRGLFQTPGYGVIHAGATVRLWTGLELFARATNLLDRQYEETLGFPALGRSGMVGVSLAARR